MNESCFYYGVITPDGYRSLMNESEFSNRKNFIVEGQSPAVKRENFSFVKARLTAEKTPYTEFCIADGCGGIFCEKFKICDEDFIGKSPCSYEKILLKKFQNYPVKNDFENETENINILKEKELLRCRRFLEACRTVQNDLLRLEQPYINREKINRFTSDVWQKITNGMKGRVGTETRRFVTCITADGSELNMEAFDSYCEKMLVISDRTGGCAGIITDRLRRYALGSGYDVISCPCTLNPDTVEHLIIPELNFGVFTSKHFHRADFENSRKIYAKRFVYRSADEIKIRTDFSLKAYRQLMNEAFASLKRIDELNRRLDGIYYGRTDFSALKNYISELLF